MIASRIILAGVVVALAGCAGGLPKIKLPANPFAKPDLTVGPSLSLLSGEVTAVGPDGYCADPASSRPRGGFAIFAPCAVLGVADAPPAVSAITTVQVGAAGSAIVTEDPAALVAVLEGANGPSILARDGNPEQVSVKNVRQTDARVAVYFTDEAPAFIDGAQEAEWRAFVDMSGRLVTVSVRGFDEAPLSDPIGASLLDQAVDALIAANTADAG